MSYPFIRLLLSTLSTIPWLLLDYHKDQALVPDPLASSPLSALNSDGIEAVLFFLRLCAVVLGLTFPWDRLSLLELGVLLSTSAQSLWRDDPLLKDLDLAINQYLLVIMLCKGVYRRMVCWFWWLSCRVSCLWWSFRHWEVGSSVMLLPSNFFICFGWSEKEMSGYLDVASFLRVVTFQVSLRITVWFSFRDLCISYTLSAHSMLVRILSLRALVSKFVDILIKLDVMDSLIHPDFTG